MREHVGELPARQAGIVLRNDNWHRSVHTVAFGGLGAAVVAMAALHLIGAGRLDPARTTVSDYVWLPGGAVLFAVAALGLALATATVPIGLITARVPGAVRLAWLYGVGCLGLVAAIAFPTNAIGAAESADTVLHRYAAGLFFVSLPVAAVLTLRLLPDKTAALLTAVSLLAGLLFLVSHVPLLFPNWPGAHVIHDLLPRGITERALLVTDMTLVAALTRRVTR